MHTSFLCSNYPLVLSIYVPPFLGGSLEISIYTDLWTTAYSYIQVYVPIYMDLCIQSYIQFLISDLHLFTHFLDIPLKINIYRYIKNNTCSHKYIHLYTCIYAYNHIYSHEYAYKFSMLQFSDQHSKP
jgi:hypothetical protein